MQNDKRIQLPHHRKHILHYVDRTDIVAREKNQVYYVNNNNNNNNNNNIYLLQLGFHPVAMVFFTCIQNMKLVTNKFKSGGLHEKHVVATWNVGNHLSICF